MIRGALVPAIVLAVVAGPAVARAEPDAAAGRAVVVGGERSEVTPCFRCHGLEGVGDSAGAFPRLAGQAAFYMYKQLIDYASGARPSEVMAPIAREMTEPQMVDVAYYYSLQIAPSLWQPEVDPAVLARGETIAEDGLRDQGLQACNLCHGENGTGQPPLFPYLAGQYAAYTELQLLLFKRGIRKNDPLAVMRDIAEEMSEEDIRAVALYYEWLGPALVDQDEGAEEGARLSRAAD